MREKREIGIERGKERDKKIEGGRVRERQDADQDEEGKGETLIVSESRGGGEILEFMSALQMWPYITETSDKY